MSRPAHVFVIAEAGVNHNGSLAMALQLVEAAAAAGADAVKFQSFHAHLLAAAGDQLEMLRALELTADEQRHIAAHCRECGIEFLSSPFDADSIDLLAT